ncbi:transcriptional regulator [Streptomyces dioscori]|uniref:Transcriptional regulator n=1 Tax=Streptomyces dioscori TaxID=2109333 RepID=A0A2P8Q9P0_9ACTN|nr:helix-turn-helix transcriptional regulator [Streptomyces dioscori]PSM42954.1 transcriptional regulator [Streptomyces dioscori]
MLTVLGISESDERTYQRFLDAGPLTAAQAARSLEVTHAHIRRSVTRLVEAGLLRKVERGRYLAVSPHTALLPLLRRRHLEAETAFADARNQVEALSERYREGRLRTDPGNLVEILSDRDLIIERTDELYGSARSHVWVLDRPPYVGRQDGQDYSNEDELALTRQWIERGMEVRSIYCPESMERPGRFGVLLELVALGEQSRMLPELPFKLHIIDKRVALVPLTGKVYDDLAVVHSSGMLDALIELYEAYWDRAEPLGGAGPSDDKDLDEQDILILSMLRTGLKDQAIARQLGYSTRTTTRRIAVVLAKLGVTTRFQAGARAVSRGLI